MLSSANIKTDFNPFLSLYNLSFLRQMFIDEKHKNDNISDNNVDSLF